MPEVAQVSADSFRPGDASGPAAVVRRVVAECLATDGHAPLDEAATLRLKHHGLDDASLWLADDTGFALRRSDGDGSSLDLAVLPSARGAGAGRSLVAAALVGSSGTVEAWAHGGHPAAAALAAEFGFERARDLWVMRRPPTSAAAGASSPTSESERPRTPGVRVRTFRPGDQAELLRVNAAAFASHPEQGSMSAADLGERMAEPWFDPAGLFLALDEDDRLLGFHWTKVHPSGDGEVYVVGIDPGAQGRGLGKLLTRAGLDHLAGRPVHLYVESDNAPAIAVYSGLGFSHAPSDTHVQYRRTAPVRP